MNLPVELIDIYFTSNPTTELSLVNTYFNINVKRIKILSNENYLNIKGDHIKQLPNLTHLNLICNDYITLNNLISLSLFENIIKDNEISNLTELRRLDLRFKIQITNAGISNLTNLTLDHNSLIKNQKNDI